ncbi:MAG: hypothetical protein AAGB03_02540 [Pseudomonadota bacterium]
MTDPTLMQWIGVGLFVSAVFVGLFAGAEWRSGSGPRAATRRWTFPRSGDPRTNAFSVFASVFDAFFGPHLGSLRFVRVAFFYSLIGTILGFIAISLATPPNDNGVRGLQSLLSLKNHEQSLSQQNLALVLFILLIKFLADGLALASTRIVAGVGQRAPWLTPVWIIAALGISGFIVFALLSLSNFAAQQAGHAGVTSLEPALAARHLLSDPVSSIAGLTETVQVLLSAEEPVGLALAIQVAALTIVTPAALLLFLIPIGVLARLLYNRQGSLSGFGQRVGAERRPLTALCVPAPILCTTLMLGAGVLTSV